jgi:sec-independent protein translocase protein TatA
MPEIGPVELIIVAFVVLLLFGPGKAADLGSSLGKGIREFRRETARGDDAPALPAANAASIPAIFCTECGSRNARDQKFCTNCGASITAAV